MSTQINPVLTAAAAAIDQVHQELSAASTNNTLPESVLVGTFLPYFSGTITPEPGQLVIAAWISIAGSPGGEVDIVDATGKVLFTTPPVIDTSLVDISGSNDSLATVFSHAELREQHIPGSGVPEVTAALASTNIQPQDKMSGWHDIFKTYGFDGQEPEVLDITIESDFLEYDS